MTKRKKITSICVAVLLVAAFVIGTTYAYLFSSNTKVNTFGIGDNVSQITEEFKPPTDNPVAGITVTKDVRVTNTGMPSYVRVYVAISSAEFEDTFSIDWNTSDWTLGSDGYWYYNSVVGKGETTKPLMTTVTFNSKIESFNTKNAEGIAVYEETVQAAGYSSATEAFSAIQ